MSITCPHCGLVHPPLVTCDEAQIEQMPKLLAIIGRADKCPCGAAIFWVFDLAIRNPVAIDVYGLQHLPCNSNPTCPSCSLVHSTSILCYQARAEQMERLLVRVGDRAVCRCKMPIWWVQHANARKAPYTAAGLNHFVDCPYSESFRRKRPQ